MRLIDLGASFFYRILLLGSDFIKKNSSFWGENRAVVRVFFSVFFVFLGAFLCLC